MSRRDKILNKNKEEFAYVVSKSTSYPNLLENLGFSNTLLKHLIQERVKEENVNISHFNIQKKIFCPKFIKIKRKMKNEYVSS